MKQLCAHCVEERDDCELVDFDGRQVLMCWDCREGPIRGGRYSFNDQGARDGCGKHLPSSPKTLMFGRGDGNRRCTAGGVSIGARGTGK